MRILNRSQVRYLTITQAIKRSQLIPIKYLGERLLGVRSDFGGRVHQDSRSPPIAQDGAAETRFRPPQRIAADIHDDDTVFP